MQRPESCRPLLHAFVGVWLFLCLAPFVGAARGPATTVAAARPVAALATPSRPTPQASDGMPCVGCYVAPAPAAQGVGGGEPGEPVALNSSASKEFDMKSAALHSLVLTLREVDRLAGPGASLAAAR